MSLRPYTAVEVKSMCRFTGFIGQNPILLSKVIVRPYNSLISQSSNARRGGNIINADGFGISWYNPKIDNLPALFKSTQPAWNDLNLLNIAKKVESSCFLAHIRASTVGSVALNNCHPFSYKQFSFVHNGTIDSFNYLRRHIVNKIDRELAFAIKAETDSEHLFFLILHFYFVEGGSNLQEAVSSALNWLAEMIISLDMPEKTAQLNIVITDGQEMIATRCVLGDKDYLSLFLTQNLDTEAPSSHSFGQYKVISSEPLTETDDIWDEVPQGSIVKIRPDSVEFTPLVFPS